MAILVRQRDGTRHEVLSECLVGRGTTCILHIDNRLVSSSHAQLRWNGTSWEVHDLDSRNGTFVDTHQLARGERLLIQAGTDLAFGDPDDVYQLVEDSPPAAHAVNQRGERRNMHEQLLILPDQDNAAFTIFQEHGKWLAESTVDGERQSVADGTVLSTCADRWTLHLPFVVERTAQRRAKEMQISDLCLHFSVSRNQEHIELTVIHDTGTIQMGHRAHMELLLRLAEARLSDQINHENQTEQGNQQHAAISSAEQGWIDVIKLMTQLGIADNATGRNLLYQHICQARKQFAKTNIVGAVGLIERRNTVTGTDARHGKQLRIGAPRVKIDRL